jgi:hypothetical protein
MQLLRRKYDEVDCNIDQTASFFSLLCDGGLYSVGWLINLELEGIWKEAAVA